MNRRSFIRNLFAAAVAPVAVVKAIQYQPPQLLKAYWYQTPMDPVNRQQCIDFLEKYMVREGCGCSLTRASIQPLTPEDIESMAEYDTTRLSQSDGVHGSQPSYHTEGDDCGAGDSLEVRDNSERADAKASVIQYCRDGTDKTPDNSQLRHWLDTWCGHTESKRVVQQTILRGA